MIAAIKRSVLVICLSGGMFAAQPPMLPNLNNTCYMAGITQATLALPEVTRILGSLSDDELARISDPSDRALFTTYRTLIQEVFYPSGPATALPAAWQNYYGASLERGGFSVGTQEDAQEVWDASFSPALQDVLPLFKHLPSYDQLFGVRVVTQLYAPGFTHEIVGDIPARDERKEERDFLMTWPVRAPRDTLQDFLQRRFLPQPLYTLSSEFEGITYPLAQTAEYAVPEGRYVRLYVLKAEPAALDASSLFHVQFDPEHPEVWYDLIAVVIREGRTIFSGHYTAYVLWQWALTENNVSPWFYCNDSIIRPVVINDPAVLRHIGQNATTLLYQRRDQEQLPSRPPLQLHASGQGQEAVLVSSQSQTSLADLLRHVTQETIALSRVR